MNFAAADWAQELMSILARSQTWAALILGGLSLAGCGGGQSLVPVEGVVKIDGSPMASVHVVFFPANSTANDPTQYHGKTDGQGHYVLRQAPDNHSGAAPGEYRVTLTTAVIEGPSDELTKLPPERVPQRYRDGRLLFKVPESGTKEANFDITSR